MRTPVTILACGIIVSVSASPAAPQRRHGPVPDAGMVGVGGSVGLSVPTDDRVDVGLSVAGNIEGYVTPRVSIRGQAGGTWQDLKTGQPFSGTIKPFWLDGNIVYNWEGGKWHPYVTGGVGMYRYAYEENSSHGAFNGSNTAFGLNVGGGIEYFFTLHATVTGEVLYHHVGEIVTALVPFGNPSFGTFSIGVKRYF